ncbi:hypothetical protein SDC9_14777 [bioreactor metagenome]|uniref:Pyridoxamine 5'-phosphate oxidase putative domain-containing protein n=1 Tax=bioreactor metagenome TaxID=1076179 RepID=A0A644TQ36_9ZZZZ|nr:pyridoxamine 5'-phosphate oxidase family protein [Negativicutes bacterium]
MFKELRRQDRALSHEGTQEILQKGVYGFLAVNSLNDYPYGIPLNYAYTNGSIYFHAAVEGQKLACLENNNKVTFCVVSESTVVPDQFSTRYKSAMVFGKAYELSGTEKVEALVNIVRKYATSEDCIIRGKQYAQGDRDLTAVFRIDIEHLTGKARR